MISAALSRIFLWCVVLALIPATGKIISVVTQKSLRLPTGNTWYISLGEPVINVTMTPMNAVERPAPDTTVECTLFNKDSIEVSKGAFRISRDIFGMDYRNELNSLIAGSVANGHYVRLDTQYTIFRHEAWVTENENNDRSDSWEKDTQGPVHFSREYYGKNRQVIKVDYDTFSSSRDAAIFSITNSKEQPYQMAETSGSTGTLQLMATGNWQRFGFSLYIVVYCAGAVFLFFLMKNLFRNFSRDEFFTQANVRLLVLIGTTILAIQADRWLFYQLLLAHIHSVKIIASSLSDSTRQYQYKILPDIDAGYILLGIGLLVLSYIFSNGLKLQREQSLTI